MDQQVIISFKWYYHVITFERRFCTNDCDTDVTTVAPFDKNTKWKKMLQILLQFAFYGYRVILLWHFVSSWNQICIYYTELDSDVRYDFIGPT